jgi:hypothetical protein
MTVIASSTVDSSSKYAQKIESITLRIDVRFGAPLTDEQRARIADIVEKTPVTKTIKAGAAIRTRSISPLPPPRGRADTEGLRERASEVALVGESAGHRYLGDRQLRTS